MLDAIQVYKLTCDDCGNVMILERNEAMQETLLSPMRWKAGLNNWKRVHMQRYQNTLWGQRWLERDRGKWLRDTETILSVAGWRGGFDVSPKDGTIVTRCDPCVLVATTLVR